MTPVCPKCQQEIERDDVNVAKDVAYCRACNEAHLLSEMAGAVPVAAQGADLLNPPPGCEVVDDGMGATIIARHRQFAGAFGLLFFALFWNGITSVFVFIAIAGTLQNVMGSVPVWFPAPEMDGAPMSLGMNLFLWLFLSPFILVGVATMAGALLSFAGRTEVRIDRTDGTLFTGIGFVGYRRHFNPQSLTTISHGVTSWAQNGEHKPLLVMRMSNGAERKFGTLLSPERQTFLAAAIMRSVERMRGGRSIRANR